MLDHSYAPHVLKERSAVISSEPSGAKGGSLRAETLSGYLTRIALKMTMLDSCQGMSPLLSYTVV